jgi:serpin B
MRSQFFAIALGLVVSSSAVTAQASAPPSLEAVVTASNAFGFDLVRHLAPDGNAFLSPASVTSALLMAYAGARGETATEMAAALRLADMGPTSNDLDRAVHALVEELNRKTTDEEIARRRRHDPGYEGTLKLHLVNALWGQKGHPFKPEYMERLSAVFGSELHAMDFKNDPNGSRLTINKRIAEQTNDRIRDLLPPDAVVSLTSLVLTNAIYFKNAWAQEFFARATKDQAFYADPETSFDVPMMRRTSSYGFFEDATTRAVRLPYADGRQSMIVVLPKERHALAATEKGLDRSALEALVKGLASRQVALELPRFKIEQTYEVADALKALGIRRAFDAQHADLSGIDGGAGQLVFDRVIHKTFVAVDEKGTEAAAATALTMRAGSARPTTEPVPFVCDEPFLFFIVDQKTGLVLFQGRCVDPRS